MKRVLVLITAIIMVVVMVGCGAKGLVEETVPTQEPVIGEVVEEEDVAVEADVEEDPGKEEKPIEVVEEAFDVTLTIPKDWVGDEATQEHFDGQAKENGWKSATLNEDGSVTYVMTKTQHKKMVDDLAQGIEDFFEERIAESDGGKYVSITANNGYTEFTVVTKESKTDIFDFATDIGLSYLGGMYSVFSGEGEKPITIKYVNAETGDIISEEKY